MGLIGDACSKIVTAVRIKCLHVSHVAIMGNGREKGNTEKLFNHSNALTEFS